MVYSEFKVIFTNPSGGKLTTNFKCRYFKLVTDTLKPNIYINLQLDQNEYNVYKMDDIELDYTPLTLCFTKFGIFYEECDKYRENIELNKSNKLTINESALENLLPIFIEMELSYLYSYLYSFGFFDYFKEKKQTPEEFLSEKYNEYMVIYLKNNENSELTILGFTTLYNFENTFLPNVKLLLSDFK